MILGARKNRRFKLENSTGTFPVPGKKYVALTTEEIFDFLDNNKAERLLCVKPAEQKKSRQNGKTQNTPKGPQTEHTAKVKQKAKPAVASVQESEPDVVEQESVPVEEPRAEPVPRARANVVTVSPVQAKADEQAWAELKITHAAELAEGVELGKRFDQEAVFRRGHDEAPIVTALTAQYFTQLRLPHHVVATPAMNVKVAPGGRPSGTRYVTTVTVLEPAGRLPITTTLRLPSGMTTVPVTF